MNDLQAAKTTTPDFLVAANDANATREVSDEVFRRAPIPILIEDWSGIKHKIDLIKARGVTDLDEYIDSNPGMIEELRRMHRFVDANDATLELFDADSKETFYAWSRQLLPANRFSNMQVLRAMFNGDKSCQGERMLVSLKGRNVPIVWRCSLPEEFHRYQQLHFYAFDVTEYKDNLERLDALRAQMAHTARVSMVGQLVASITHEIGQPLAAIRTSVEASVRWLERAKPNVMEAVAALRNASQWADDTTEICRRLRSFLGDAPIEAACLDCDEIINSAMSLVAPQANSKSITLRKEVEPAITAFADRIHVQQVLTNLLINSVHAIEAADREETGFVQIRATSHGDAHTLFEVIDTGCGIRNPNPDAVFEPFLSTKRDGMGMGLPISKSIVESHGGKIWVASTDECGTRFCFTLPRSSTHTVSSSSIRFAESGRRNPV